ncbi:MAG: hypothetical protein ACE5FC_11180 [Myxococcota bacterium]
MHTLRACPAPALRAAFFVFALAALVLAPAFAAGAEPEAAGKGTLPDLKTLTRVPITAPLAPGAEKKDAGKLDEQAWRARFRVLRGEIERKERELALKRAELYDKIEEGSTAKKPRRFAIEGFVINTEKTGDEPEFIDPLEREVYEREQDLTNLHQALRELEFQASVAGVPKAWRR